MFWYAPVEDRQCSLDLGKYLSFGLLAQKKTAAGWVAVAVVPDVSSDKRIVFTLLEKCNRLQLDPQQLYDVILDAIS